MLRFSLLVMLLAVAGCAEDYLTASSSLEVLVTADDEPVGGVTVTASPRDSAFDAERGETSSAGVARFAPIFPGVYELEFRHDEVVCESQVVQVPAWTDAQHPVTCWDTSPTMLLLPGHLEFERDTVRMSVGDRLIITQRYAPSDPEPRTVYERYTRWLPEVFPCTDVPRAIPVDPAPCEVVAEFRSASRPDTPIIVTDSMMVAIARVLPCAIGPDGQPLMPEAWASSGMFSECATWGTALTEAGPGIEVVSASILTATACGRSWVSKTERDGWRRPWPEPFDGYARLEVEVVC